MSEAPFQFKTTRGPVTRDPATGERRRTVLIERDREAEAKTAQPAAAEKVPARSPRARE